MARYLHQARGTLLYKEAVCVRGKSHYGLCYNIHRLLSFSIQKLFYGLFFAPELQFLTCDVTYFRWFQIGRTARLVNFARLWRCGLVSDFCLAACFCYLFLWFFKDFFVKVVYSSSDLFSMHLFVFCLVFVLSCFIQCLLLKPFSYSWLR